MAWLMAALVTCSSWQLRAMEDDGPREAELGESSNPVFAFCFDTHDTQKRDLAAQATMLRELGFDGAGHIGLEDVPARLETLDAQRLRLFLIGVRVDLSSDDQPYPATLGASLAAVRGRNVVLYVTIGGSPVSSAKANGRAVRVLKELNQVAKANGVRVALYPHTGDWMVKVSHAVELAQQVNDENLGVIFNLCHWMKNEELSQLEPLLEVAIPHLFVVTINGADAEGKSDADWGRLIQPLDRGSYDVRHFVHLLRGRGFRGPVGIMCYGIADDARDHLSRSIRVWHSWQRPGLPEGR